MTAKDIISEFNIMLVKSNSKHSYREYYIGSTDDIQKAYLDHNISKDKDWNVFYEADSIEMAREVVEHFRIMRMESDLSKIYGKFVYCYKINMHTKEI